WTQLEVGFAEKYMDGTPRTLQCVGAPCTSNADVALDADVREMLQFHSQVTAVLGLCRMIMQFQRQSFVVKSLASNRYPWVLVGSCHVRIGTTNSGNEFVNSTSGRKEKKVGCMVNRNILEKIIMQFQWQSIVVKSMATNCIHRYPNTKGLDRAIGILTELFMFRRDHCQMGPTKIGIPRRASEIRGASKGVIMVHQICMPLELPSLIKSHIRAVWDIKLSQGATKPVPRLGLLDLVVAMVCKLGKGRMATILRLLAPGDCPNITEAEVIHDKCNAQVIHKELHEANETNLLDEEDNIISKYTRNEKEHIKWLTVFYAIAQPSQNDIFLRLGLAIRFITLSETRPDMHVFDCKPLADPLHLVMFED
ncbi:hypothetical protein ACLOJK_018028, partial [Asimina triloba]